MRLGFLTGIILFSAIFLRAQDNFQITYLAAGDEVIEWLVPSTDGNLILGGNTNTFDSSGDGFLIKTDQNGNIIWSKVFGGPGQDVLVKIIACTDGGCVVIGHEDSYGQGDYEAYIYRFDNNGELLWSDFFGTSMWDGSKAVIQTKNGGFMVVGHTNDFGGGFMLSLNSQGDLLWKKEYMTGDIFWFTNVFETDEGGFYVAGAINHSGFGIHDSFILETDQTGNFIRCKYYGGSQNDAIRSLFPYEGGFLAVGDTWSYQSHLVAWIIKINPNLSINKAIILGDFDYNQALESVCFMSNSIYMALKMTGMNAYIVELDPSLALKKSWQFKAGSSSYSSLVISPVDGSIVFGGSSTNDQTYRKDAYLTKFHPEDNTYDCNIIPHTTSIQNINVQSSNLSLSPFNNDAVFQKINIDYKDFPLQTQRLCLLLPVADFSGPVQVCANDPVSFTNNCQNGETYHWTFQGGVPASSDSYNPGTIMYENPGYFSIKLVVTNEVGADSIVRHITVNPIPEVYLGADTTLQEDDETLLLDAGSGMDSYLWQDGSTGQTFEVSEEGMYWVTVEKNSCISSDTIIVTYGDCLASFYCNDEACIYETVSITNYCKTSEFYQWYFEGAVPGSSTSNDPGFIHYEYPGTFMIKLVVTNNGVKDSVIKYIDIYPIPEVYLGEDTIAPMGQSLILDAGLGMDHYLWQDGSSEQTYEVFQDGMYWVRVIENNCLDFDTIFITFDDCIASLEIPNCFTPNGDGFNETFIVESRNLIGFTMVIYNRWGQELFETDDPQYGWDGKVNGRLCPIGTYFYIIRYTTRCSSGVDKDGISKGSITLLE